MGLSILWAHNNLRTIVHRMEAGIVQIGSSEKFQRDYSGIRKAFSQKWNDANKGLHYFIPSQRDWWFEKIEGVRLIETLHINEDFIKMSLHKTPVSRKPANSRSKYLSLGRLPAQPGDRGCGNEYLTRNNLKRRCRKNKRDRHNGWQADFNKDLIQIFTEPVSREAA